ncbi:hydrolase [Pelagibius sp. Alg239-R121]|uniref:hydrolase n=1 Tax=Pelagibius sp. Alg239-R121 TaxID=2993448 RepID=UPI0024A66BDE|nr:hydrolase [Pelagibius sp. Alg239-R121]
MLIQSEKSLLLIIDVQERLAPAIFDAPRSTANIIKLLTAAQRLNLPRLVTEHYPGGLGTTLAEVAAFVSKEDVFEKIHFSSLAEPGFQERLQANGRRQLVVAGMETHVCLLQSVLDLHEAGYDIFVVADATGSRTAENASLAIERMRAAGIQIVSTEMVIFEWIHRVDIDCFKELFALIK